ncbi:MAG: glycosyltransferase [Actinobacteria bacterium]|nr:glycosyltransferase [Actinomycetota bacterium]
MRIGVLGADWPDSFANNIASGLADLGHEVTGHGDLRPRTTSPVGSVLVDNAFRSHALDVRWQDRKIDAVLAASPDIVICSDGRVTPAAVDRLKRAGVRTAMWFPDHVANFGRLSMLAAPFDVLAVKDPTLVARLQACYTRHARYLPEACNPQWHAPPPNVAPRPGPVVVAGNIYPTRMMLLHRLHADGVPLLLYGSGFPRWSDPGPLKSLHTSEHVTGTRKATVFRSASAVLNNLHPAEVGANARLFEAAGSGAVVLAEHRPALDELFDRDELLTFSNYDELLEKALAASRGEVEGEAIGDRAAARAHAEHRYQDRLLQLLDWLE